MQCLIPQLKIIFFISPNCYIKFFIFNTVWNSKNLFISNLPIFSGMCLCVKLRFLCDYVHRTDKSFIKIDFSWMIWFEILISIIYYCSRGSEKEGKEKKSICIWRISEGNNHTKSWTLVRNICRYSINTIYDEPWIMLVMVIDLIAERGEDENGRKGELAQNFMKA